MKQIYPLKQAWHRVVPRNNLSFAGHATLQSGSVSVTVSTQFIDAQDAIVLYGTRPNSIGVAANSGGGVVVTSLVNGVSFNFARPTGVACPWDEVVMWELVRRSPKPNL